MIALAGLIFLRPLWLIAIPVAIALAVLAHRRAAASGWGRLIDAHLGAYLRSAGLLRHGTGHRRVPALAASAVVAAIALAGPATPRTTTPALRNLDTVVLVIDMSRSITESGALDAVRAVASDLFAIAGGRPIALVLFAGEAYLASPPTDDPRLLETFIAVLADDTMPDAGSRPDRGLALAAEIAARGGGRRRDVVLLSDGGGIGAEAIHEARLLRESGARVSAIFVPPVREPYGMPPSQRGALERLVDTGGGELADAGDVRRLATVLAEPPSAAVERGFVAVAYDDHGRAILVLALIPMLLLFRRRG